jgi:hypothetical protein
MVTTRTFMLRVVRPIVRVVLIPPARPRQERDERNARVAKRRPPSRKALGRDWPPRWPDRRLLPLLRRDTTQRSAGCVASLLATSCRKPSLIAPTLLCAAHRGGRIWRRGRPQPDQISSTAAVAALGILEAASSRLATHSSDAIGLGSFWHRGYRPTRRRGRNRSPLLACMIHASLQRARTDKAISCASS